jgi:hypothetical protein
MVQMTPSSLLLKLSWDSERSASFDFTLPKRKKAVVKIYLGIREAGGSS